MDLNLSHFLQLYVPKSDPDAPSANKDKRSQVEQFLTWLALEPVTLDDRLFARYAEYLTQVRQLKTTSVRTHLAALRAWLRSLLRDPDFQQALTAFLPVADSEREGRARAVLTQFWDMIDPAAFRV